MIKVVINKQLGDPVIEFYRNGRKMSLVAENLEVTNLVTSFDIDVKIKVRRKKSKKF